MAVIVTISLLSEFPLNDVSLTEVFWVLDVGSTLEGRLFKLDGLPHVSIDFL